MDALARVTRANFGELPLTCTDGAWGTELQALGAEPGELTDIWNVSAPEKVMAVAAAYVEAGAGIILTNTFSSNSVALGRHRVDVSAPTLARAGAEISRKAAGTRARVFGSIGPTGKMIALKSIDAESAFQAAAEQARALADGGVDAIVIEDAVGTRRCAGGARRGARRVRPSGRRHLLLRLRQGQDANGHGRARLAGLRPGA